MNHSNIDQNEESGEKSEFEEDIREIPLGQLKNSLFYTYPREKPPDDSSFSNLKGWIPDPQRAIIGKAL